MLLIISSPSQDKRFSPLFPLRLLATQEKASISRHIQDAASPAPTTKPPLTARTAISGRVAGLAHILHTYYPIVCSLAYPGSKELQGNPQGAQQGAERQRSKGELCTGSWQSSSAPQAPPAPPSGALFGRISLYPALGGGDSRTRVSSSPLEPLCQGKCTRPGGPE